MSFTSVSILSDSFSIIATNRFSSSAFPSEYSRVSAAILIAVIGVFSSWETPATNSRLRASFRFAAETSRMTKSARGVADS